MNCKIACFVLAGLCATSLGFAQDEEDEEELAAINASTIPYVYYNSTAKQLPLAWLASQVSSDFGRSPDEFAEHDLLVQMTPGLNRKLKALKDAPEFVLKIDGTLPRYDFEKSAFPFPMSLGHFARFGDYTVQLVNLADYSVVPVPEAKARDFQMALRKSRGVTLEMRVVPNAKPSDEKAIHVRIKSAKLVLHDGRTIAEITR